ncbi:MAG: hypothetical protein R3B13_30140 [Polyangiaceae bacterium]
MTRLTLCALAVTLGPVAGCGSDDAGGAHLGSGGQAGCATDCNAAGQASAGGGSVGAAGGNSGGAAASAGATSNAGTAGAGAQPAACDPPNSQWQNGVCVPSCGAAGGNLCEAAGSAACDGFKPIDSYDCAVCCNRPAVEPAPASFHFVIGSAPQYWNSILTLSEQNPNVVFLASNKPPQVGPERWSAYLSYRSTPQPTAADINALLSSGAGAPRFVMLEELHNAESEQFFVKLATEMASKYPQWKGRWGGFLSFGNYPVLSAGIDALLKAHAIISLELYPRYSEYCKAGTSAGQRDVWLGNQFAGTSTLGRLNWLMARRKLNSSESSVTPLFGVGDVLLDGSKPAVFLDRMFYVWATRTNYPSLISAANGGPGVYKWSPPTAAGYGVSNTSRDLAFAESFAHYSAAGKTTSRLGQVPCP